MRALRMDLSGLHHDQAIGLQRQRKVMQHADDGLGGVQLAVIRKEFKTRVGRTVFIRERHEQHAGPGHWNDPDMLVVGAPSLLAVWMPAVKKYFISKMPCGV